MADTIRTFNNSITVSSGEGSSTLSSNVYNVLTKAGGYIEQILVSAPNNRAVFDFYIEDEDGFIVWDMTGAKGKINDTTRVPIRGTYTLYITNSDTDGSFSWKLKFLERW